MASSEPQASTLDYSFGAVCGKSVCCHAGNAQPSLEHSLCLFSTCSKATVPNTGESSSAHVSAKVHHHKCFTTMSLL